MYSRYKFASKHLSLTCPPDNHVRELQIIVLHSGCQYNLRDLKMKGTSASFKLYFKPWLHKKEAQYTIDNRQYKPCLYKDTRRIVTKDTRRLFTKDTRRLVTKDTRRLVTMDTRLVTKDTRLVTKDTRRLVTKDTRRLVTKDTRRLVTKDTRRLVTKDT